MNQQRYAHANHHAKKKKSRISTMQLRPREALESLENLKNISPPEGSLSYVTWQLSISIMLLPYKFNPRNTSPVKELCRFLDRMALFCFLI
jgi:hypothetical protein